MPAAWQEISALYPNNEKMARFIFYFEKTWVGNRNRRPLYPAGMWNQRILLQLMTTNNNFEGFHHGFISLASWLATTTQPSRSRAGLVRWLSAVKDRENLTFGDITRHLTNILPNKINPVALGRQTRLRGLLPNYETIDLLTYLNLYNVTVYIPLT